MKNLIAAIMLFVLSPSVAAAQQAESQILQDTLDQYILPKYEQLQTSAASLNEASAQLCTEPNASNLSAARQSFQQLVLSWARIEWFRVGPVLSENRVERFFFFPDRKGTGLRQVQAALATQDPSVTKLEELQKKSVALQGFNALDFILFGTGSEALSISDPHRCQFALTVSANLAEIAQTVLQAWQADEELRTQWLTPDETNPLFRNHQEAVNEVLGTLVHGLEAIRDTRVNVFLREPDARDRPKSAALWRSQSVLPAIHANIQGLFDLFNQSNIASLAIDEETAYLPQSLNFEFTQALEASARHEGPIAQILADPETREDLVYLRFILNALIERLDSEFATAVGLSAGFSFGDGD